MKIAICNNRAAYQVGGVDRVTTELAKAFSLLRHEVIFVYKFGLKSNISGIQSYRLKYPKIPFINGLFFSLGLAKFLNKLNPDLVITQLSSAPFFGKIKQKHLHLIYNLEMLEILNANIDYGLFFERPLIIFCEILNSLRADKVLVINKKLVRQTSSLYRIKPEYVNLGVDTQKFKPIKQRKVNKIPRIICVVRGDKRRKNLSLLIRAYEGLNVQLRLTNSPFKKLPKNIIDLGYLSENRLVEELQNADAFILPSKQEGFGLATLEALACNIPVIITKTGIWEEVVKFKVGEVIEASVQGIRDGIKKVLETNYGSRPRKLAERYSWDKTAQSILKIAKSIK